MMADGESDDLSHLSLSFVLSLSLRLSIARVEFEKLVVNYRMSGKMKDGKARLMR